MATHWYALRVKPHKERSVGERLQAQAIEVFLPLIRVKPVNPRAARQRPYFPGYMFVHVDLDDIGANVLNWTPGAHGLVSFGGEPAIVPVNLVDEVRRRMQALEAIGGITPQTIKKGDPVRIVRGPFAGYDAIFDEHLSGRDRVQVLLAFLSRYPQPLQIDSDDIEKR